MTHMHYTSDTLYFQDYKTSIYPEIKEIERKLLEKLFMTQCS